MFTAFPLFTSCLSGKMACRDACMHATGRLMLTYPNMRAIRQITKKPMEGRKLRRSCPARISAIANTGGCL